MHIQNLPSVGRTQRRLQILGGPLRVGCLLLPALLLASCASRDFVHYEYTIRVQAYGPKEVSEQPGTVTLTWPGGETRELSFPSRRVAATETIDWPIVKAPPDVFIDPVMFQLHVTAGKAGYRPWEASFSSADFVEVSHHLYRRIDTVVLQPQPPTLSAQQLAALDQALPTGLDVYTTQEFEDIDGDGVPEAILYRMAGLSRGSGRLADAQIWSWRRGQWTPLFQANHRGVAIEGRPVPDVGPAPNGYSFETMSGTQMRKVAPADAHGRPIPGQARTYAWSASEGTFTIVPP